MSRAGFRCQDHLGCDGSRLKIFYTPLEVEPQSGDLLQYSEMELREAALRRDRQAFKTGAVGVANQVLSRILRLIVIPLSIQMLGLEQYGVWLVVGSLVAWGGLTDFGLAPGLVNVIASAQGRSNRAEMRQAITTALIAYAVLAAIVAAIALILSRSEGLPALLGVKDANLAASTRMLVLVCGLIFAVSTLTRVVDTTARALQEGYIGSYWQIAGALTSLCLLFMVRQHSQGLLAYALIVSGPTVLAQVGLAVHIFRYRHPDLRPAWTCCDWATFRKLWGFAGPLTLLQLSNLAGLYSANLLIGNRLGAAFVPAYSVPYALFAAIKGVIWMIVSPYLPALAEAVGRGDWKWVVKRVKRVFGMGIAIAVGCGGVVVLAGDPFLKLWTGGVVQAGMSMLMALYMFSVLDVGSEINRVVLQGLGLVRRLAGTYCCVTVFMVLMSWFFLPLFGLLTIPIAGATGCAMRLILTLPRVFHVLSIARAAGVSALADNR